MQLISGNSRQTFKRQRKFDSETSPAMIDKVAAIEAVCKRHHVPLRAADLHFPMAHPAMAAIMPCLDESTRSASS